MSSLFALISFFELTMPIWQGVGPKWDIAGSCEWGTKGVHGSWINISAKRKREKDDDGWTVIENQRLE